MAKKTTNKEVNLKATIEDHVQNRRYLLADASIKKWLKAGASVESKITACDWFRRLGDFKQAYRTIAPADFRFNRVKANSIEAKQYLWSARMLNLLGASAFAKEIVKRLPTFERAEENRMIANIYLANFDSEAALPFFKLAEKTDTQAESYSSRIGKIGTCDALAGIGKHEEAIIRLKKIPCKADEKLLRGILLQAEGEYLARTGKYKSALSVLSEALPYFPIEDQTLDRHFLSKWRGISLIGSKQEETGLKELEGALNALTKPEYRAEVWLDCIYWKSFFGLANSTEIDLLFDYPGLPEQFKSRYPIPENREINPKAKPTFWISFPKQEWKSTSQNFHSLPKEIELLGLLRSTYPTGINLARLSTLLWPGEVGSYLYLEGRIQQLLRRLRNEYDISVQTKNQQVTLSQVSADQVTVEIFSTNLRPLVFKDREEISLQEVQEFYQIKRTQAHHLVATWIENKRVTTHKSGRNVFLRSRRDS